MKNHILEKIKDKIKEFFRIKKVPVKTPTKKILRLAKKQLKKKKAAYHRKTGKTSITNKRFVRYRFSLWRMRIDEEKIPHLITLLKKKYQKVENKDKQLVAQRIGVQLINKEKKTMEITSRKTKRKKNIEVQDMISTGSYERAKESKDHMFSELAKKIEDYLTKRTGRYSIELEEDEELALKNFHVMYSEP